MSELLEDFATTRVPEERTTGGIRIGMIYGAMAFSVPGLITGLEIGGALGFDKSLFAFLVGGFLLAVIGSVTGILGMRNRLTSYMTLKFVFGPYGAILLSLAFAMSLLGWYGVSMDLLSSVSNELSLQLFGVSTRLGLIEVVAGIVVTLTTIFGFRALERLSALIVPLLFVVILYMLYRSLNYDVVPTGPVVPTTSELGYGEAISAVVGSFIVSAAIFPDFTRFAARKRDAVVAAFLPFFVLSTFVYVVSALAGSVIAQTDLLVVMLALGLGGFALVLLIVSSLITCAVNLYSASLGVSSTIPKFKEWKIVVFTGILGTVAASFNLLENFTDFLYGLSVIFIPVAAVCIADFFFVRGGRIYMLEDVSALRKINWQAIAAWGAGIAASWMSNQDLIFITSVEVCDAILVTIPVYLLLMKFSRRENRSASDDKVI